MSAAGGGVVSAVITLASGGYAAANAATGGFDYTGLAALVTAISGLVATLGALIIGLRRSTSSNVTDLAKVVEALEEHKKKMQGGEPG